MINIRNRKLEKPMKIFYLKKRKKKGEIFTSIEAKEINSTQEVFGLIESVEYNGDHQEMFAHPLIQVMDSLVCGTVKYDEETSKCLADNIAKNKDFPNNLT